MLIYWAWNIWRWFLADLGYESWYECVFVDVKNDLIDALNFQKSYKHITVWKWWKKEKIIEKVRGVHWWEKSTLIKEIISADIITTAVWKDSLKYIVPILQEWLIKRIKKWNTEPLSVSVIAFENIHWNTDYLKSILLEWLSHETKKMIQDNIVFPNSLVDRIVPHYDWSNLLEVCVEDYYQIAIEPTKDDLSSKIKWIEITNDLAALADQKLFTLNTWHAMCAYLWSLAWFRYIHEVIEQKDIRRLIASTMNEMTSVLTELYPKTITIDSHEAYIEKTMERFKNQYLQDTVSRVARDPIRKLSKIDRLIHPYITLFNNGITPYYLWTWIAAALHYKNNNDQQSWLLQQEIQVHGVEKIIKNRLWVIDIDQANLIRSQYLLRKL